MSLADRLLIVLAGLSGLAGVALSAAGAHATGGSNLEIAGRFLLIHAAALVGLAALAGTGFVHPGVARAGGWAILVGVALSPATSPGGSGAARRCSRWRRRPAASC